jgi:hypothetical protein
MQLNVILLRYELFDGFSETLLMVLCYSVDKGIYISVKIEYAYTPYEKIVN